MKYFLLLEVKCGRSAFRDILLLDPHWERHTTVDGLPCWLSVAKWVGEQLGHLSAPITNKSCGSLKSASPKLDPWGKSLTICSHCFPSMTQRVLCSVISDARKRIGNEFLDLTADSCECLRTFALQAHIYETKEKGNSTYWSTYLRSPLLGE